MQLRNKMMQRDAIVSVIILTFNSELYIKRAVLSVLNQTYNNIEILIVDAGSTDNTKSIALGLSQIVWLDLPESDMGMARNYGVRHSNGDFIMFLDSDDFYLDNKIKNQVETLRINNSIDAVFCPAYIYRQDNPLRLGIKKYSNKVLTLDNLLNGEIYTLATMCLRKSAWNENILFGEGGQGRYGEDWRFELNMVYNGIKMGFINNVEVVVEIRKDSHTSWEMQPIMKRLALETVTPIINSLSIDRLSTKKYRKLLDNYKFKYIVSLLANESFILAIKESRNIEKKSIRYFLMILLIVISRFPNSWIKGLVRRIWISRQNSTFDWEDIDKNTLQQFVKLNVINKGQKV
jgi:glycosyltransferase involved in cell wall biosynthesis